MKILITGFDPFGGESVNPACEAVKLLPDTIAGAEIMSPVPPAISTEAFLMKCFLEIVSFIACRFAQKYERPFRNGCRIYANTCKIYNASLNSRGEEPVWALKKLEK